jgi:hypothetical protein
MPRSIQYILRAFYLISFNGLRPRLLYRQGLVSDVIKHVNNGFKCRKLLQMIMYQNDPYAPSEKTCVFNITLKIHLDNCRQWCKP